MGHPSYMEKNRYMKIDKMDRDRDIRGSFWKKIIVFFTYLLCLYICAYFCQSIEGEL